MNARFALMFLRETSHLALFEAGSPTYSIRDIGSQMWD